MIRKLLDSLTLFLLIASCLMAQSGEFKITQKPKALASEAQNFSIYGLSPNGRFIFGGTPSSTAFCYDTKRDTTSLFLSDDGLVKYRIHAATNEGLLFLSKDGEGTVICNMAQKVLQTLKTPLANWPDVVPAYVTPDGKHLVGYMMDPTYEQPTMTLPLYGSCADDGTWTLEVLPSLEKDYFKRNPNYTQAFFCSPDGTKILGRQNTYSGADRPLYWQKNNEGKWVCTTPIDSYLYNLDVPLPGPEPVYEDYVTADPEKEPELFEKQEAAFNKAYDEWNKKYTAVYKATSTDLTWQEMATASGYWMILVHESKGEGEDITTVNYPGALNVYNGSIESLNIPEAYGMGGLGRTEDGGWICYPDGMDMTQDLSTYIIYPDGKKIPLLDYLKEKTGEDLTEFFTYSYTPYGETKEVSKTDIGIAHFSADGMTMTSCAINMEGSTLYRNAFLRFDRNPLAKPLSVAPIVIEPSTIAIRWYGEALHFSKSTTGTLYLYDMAGRQIKHYELTSCTRLPLNELIEGLYVGQLITKEGVSTVRFSR